MVKVVAISGSPRMEKGNTHLILTPFLEGMREAGAEVELFYAKKLKIRPCQGEWHCALKKPGECFQKDDMQTLHPKLLEADIWVLATPLYVSGMTGPLKNLIDRILIPIGMPNLEIRDGDTRHAIREDVKRGKIVLVSNCAYWKMENFDLLIDQVKAFAEHAEWEYAGAVLRPHGEVMRPMMAGGVKLDDIFKAAKEAGSELIKEGQMKAETLRVVSRVLLPLDQYGR